MNMNQALSRNRQRGTTLVEVLVVIVVFLVGILAVAQIFPGGFRILDRTRDAAMASALLDTELERLKAKGGSVPNYVAAVQPLGNGLYAVDITRSPQDYAPNATGIRQDGVAMAGATPTEPWTLVSGANHFRRIVGEGHRLSAPRFLSASANSGTPFGSVVNVDFAPLEVPRDAAQPLDLAVYGREYLIRRGDRPTGDIAEYEVALENAENQNARIHFPNQPGGAAALYRVSATVNALAGGNLVQFALVAQVPTVGVDPVAAAANIFSPLPGGATFVSLDPSSVQVNRLYEEVPFNLPIAFTAGNGYQYTVLNRQLGILMFNPAAYTQYDQRPGSSREPKRVYFDYTVRDWRALREDFRLSNITVGVDLPNGTTDVAQVASNVYRVAIPSLRTVTDRAPDNTVEQQLELSGLFELVPPAARLNVDLSPTQAANTDNMFLVDLETGGVLYENYNAVQTIRVNKGLGEIQFFDADANPVNGVTGAILLPTGATEVVRLDDRALRVVYSAKKNWALHIFKAANRYSVTTTATGLLGPTFVYPGGANGALAGLNRRIYFPRMDAGQTVSIGRLHYIDSNGTPRTLEGVQGVVRFYTRNESIAVPMPAIDLEEIVPDANPSNVQLNLARPGGPLEGVRGASIKARAFWNPNFFALTNDEVQNLNFGYSRWARQWNIRTKETFIDRNESAE